MVFDGPRRAALKLVDGHNRRRGRKEVKDMPTITVECPLCRKQLEITVTVTAGEVVSATEATDPFGPAGGLTDAGLKLGDLEKPEEAPE